MCSRSSSPLPHVIQACGKTTVLIQLASKWLPILTCKRLVGLNYPLSHRNDAVHKVRGSVPPLHLYNGLLQRYHISQKCNKTWCLGKVVAALLSAMNILSIHLKWMKTKESKVGAAFKDLAKEINRSEGRNHTDSKWLGFWSLVMSFVTGWSNSKSGHSCCNDTRISAMVDSK